MSGFAIELQPMSLANAGEGHLEEAFQSRLAEALDIFRDHESYEGETVKVTITCNIDLVYDPATDSLATLTAAQLKKPKRRATRSSARLRDGVILVEPENHNQMGLFGKPKPVANGD